jgi:hypothetical protein
MNRVIATGVETGIVMETVLVQATAIQNGTMDMAPIGDVEIEETTGEQFRPHNFRNNPNPSVGAGTTLDTTVAGEVTVEDTPQPMLQLRPDPVSIGILLLVTSHHTTPLNIFPLQHGRIHRTSQQSPLKLLLPKVQLPR